MAENGRGSWNDTVIEQFLEGRERIADTFDRSYLLLLDTTGVRTGQNRTAPLAYLTDGDRLVVTASAAGADKNPAWYGNLVATPEVTVRRWQDGALEQFDAVAEPVQGSERERLWARFVAMSPGFADYQRKTSRVIPVITLRRR